MGKEQQQSTIARLYEDSVGKRRKQRDGVVVTPLEVVDFQVRSVLQNLKTQGYHWTDPRIEWLDPFGGTGIFLARLLQIVPVSPWGKVCIARRCIMLEIDREAAQIAANNLAIVHREETGLRGKIRVLCVDTFSLPPDVDLWSPQMDRFTVTPLNLLEIA